MDDRIARRLDTAVMHPLKVRFVGRDEVVDLIALAAIAGEHLFLYGPPGTAKSLLVREFASGVQCRYFEYLLTRFSEPNEIFGPIDLIRLREGVVATVTNGMLPEAEFAFLDELFNANSAILNNLLTVLNERVYRRGIETHRLPLITAFAASNHLPEDESLQALFDRFLLRCVVSPLPRDRLPELLAAGWSIERGGTAPVIEKLSADDLREMNQRMRHVDLSAVWDTYASMVGKVRDLGVSLSDRRAVKVLKLVAASAVQCDRDAAQLSDLWIFRYVWDRLEQIGPLAALVNGLLQDRTEDRAHPQSIPAGRVDPELLAQELEAIALEAVPGLKLGDAARLRERVQAILDRIAWVQDTTGREHLLNRATELSEKIG